MFGKNKLKTKQSVWPHDIIYEEYLQMCKDRKIKPRVQLEYRKVVENYLLEEKIKLLYNVPELSDKETDKIAKEYNTALFTFGTHYILAIIPWYDPIDRFYKITVWNSK